MTSPTAVFAWPKPIDWLPLAIFVAVAIGLPLIGYLFHLLGRAALVAVVAASPGARGSLSSGPAGMGASRHAALRGGPRLADAVQRGAVERGLPRKGQAAASRSWRRQAAVLCGCNRNSRRRWHCSKRKNGRIRRRERPGRRARPAAFAACAGPQVAASTSAAGASRPAGENGVRPRTARRSIPSKRAACSGVSSSTIRPMLRAPGLLQQLARFLRIVRPAD